MPLPEGERFSIENQEKTPAIVGGIGLDGSRSQYPADRYRILYGISYPFERGTVRGGILLLLVHDFFQNGA